MRPNDVTIFMCGDVMTGRGIDQILPHPAAPRIYEPYMDSALGYVELAERAHGPIPGPAGFSYIWGDAFEEFRLAGPDVKIINLETAVTRSEDYEDKGINYRMDPANIPCITAAGIDCCALANNHILDWGVRGLAETIMTLKNAGLACCGAGGNIGAAAAPAVIKTANGGRVLVFSMGSETSGIPRHWAASEDRAGVNLLADLTPGAARPLKKEIEKQRRQGDIVVASVHWGGNWGFDVPDAFRQFAYLLIDEAGVDIIHGHSSHHPKGIEVHSGKLILYGCGDFINDYEGIEGYEHFRPELGLMYFAKTDMASGRLLSLRMTPTLIRRFRVNRAEINDALWLTDMITREGGRFNTRASLGEDGRLALEWDFE
ncbi:MAG: CapA family protein [Nitrospiraceae bacterium]|nr:CapA family protein [Nitrospiraceae bacterium]